MLQFYIPEVLNVQQVIHWLNTSLNTRVLRSDIKLDKIVFSPLPILCTPQTKYSVLFIVFFLLQIEDEVDEINAKVFSELERKLQDWSQDYKPTIIYTTML